MDQYEVEKAWKDGKGLLGIYIHNLKNRLGNQSAKGKNPFDGFTVGQERLSDIVRAYDPPFRRSTTAYAYIEDNIADWIESAIQIRGSY